MARRPTGPLRVHLHAQARLLAKSGRGLLFQTCPLRPAPHPCRIQTRTKGPHHGCHGSLQPEPRRSYMVLQARKGRAIGFELWKRSTRKNSFAFIESQPTNTIATSTHARIARNFEVRRFVISWPSARARPGGDAGAVGRASGADGGDVSGP